MNSNLENVKYDEFVKSYNNAWGVKIDGKMRFFPYSLCEIDEKSKVVSCPMWLIIAKELEDYIDE